MHDSTHSEGKERALARRGSSRWRLLRHAAALLALLALAYLLWSRWDHDAVLAWKEQAGPVRYFATMAILPAVGVPLTPFFIVAGATFGVGGGTLGSMLALAANLTLCYWLATSKLRSRIEKLLRRFGYQLPDFEGETMGALRFTLFVKFFPGIPAAAKNYLLGLARVPFALYFAASMLVTGSFGAALVLLGESLFEHDLSHTALAMGVIVLIALALWWLRKRRARAAQQ